MQDINIWTSFEEIIKFTQKYTNIWVYGAGEVAKIIISAFEYAFVPVKGCLVTKKEDKSPGKISTVNVYPYDDADIQKTDIIVISVTKRELQLQILDKIMASQKCDVILINVEVIGQIKEFFLDDYLPKFNPIYTRIKGKRMETSFVYVKESSTNFMVREHKFGGITPNNQEFYKKNIKKLFERQYGVYRNLKDMTIANDIQLSDDYIYASCSIMDQLMRVYPPYVAPTLCGADYVDEIDELRDELYQNRDNTGDNISYRNRNYSECTVLYWIWKNATIDKYVGLCHFRRKLSIPVKSLAALEEAGIDILLTTPTVWIDGIKAGFVNRFITEYDWQCMLEAISVYSKQYYVTAQAYEKSCFYPPCNLFVMNKSSFYEYCDFAFSVTEYIHHKNIQNGLIRWDRYMGYIMENLLGVFAMHHKSNKKIVYTEMEFGNVWES